MKVYHDIHTHTNLSHCCGDPAATTGNYVRRAAELGHKVFGISNHLWDPTVAGAGSFYKTQMVSYGLELRHAIPADTCGMKVMLGAETEYYGDKGILGMTAETAKQFDYILVPHTHTHMRNLVLNETADITALKKLLAARIAPTLPELSEAQINKMASSLSNRDMDALVANGVFFAPTVDTADYCAKYIIRSFRELMANEEFIKMTRVVPVSIAHPFYPCGLTREEVKRIVDMLPKEDLIECMQEAKKLGVSLEINVDCARFPEDDYANEPAIRWLKLAKQVGCTITLGTDTHSLTGLDEIRKGELITTAAGITEDDLPAFVKG